jgi:opacity protein-like surface antigen
VQLSLTNILNKHIRLLVLLWVILTPVLLSASTQEQMSKSIDEFNAQKGKKEYSFDAGLQVGAGYYIGDANSIPFVQPRYVIGAQVRYKMTNQRLALQFKMQRTCVAYDYTMQESTEQPLQPTIYQNPMWNADLVCEFNFFKFGSPSYDYRVKTVTPYIFLGVGGSVSNKAAMLMTEESIPMIDLKKMNVSVYVPVGIGLKWKVADRWQVQVAWQHQIYFSDNVEGYLPNIDFSGDDKITEMTHGVLNNSHDLNGWNILNNDLTSTLTIGIAYEFGDQRYKKYLNEKSAVSVRIKRGAHIED